MTSHDKLCAAIAIIQAEILARDSATTTKIFGNMYFDSSHLEMAGRLMVECIGDLEHTIQAIA